MRISDWSSDVCSSDLPALAAVQFDRATHSDAKDPRPYNALGILRDQAGEHEAAQAFYRSALERDPTNLSVRNNLGLSLALTGKRDEAIELMAELAVDPEAGQTVRPDERRVGTECVSQC